MARLVFVRIAGALGITALGFFFVSLIPFLSVDAGARPVPPTPAVSVNRALKGDRLPLPSEINAAFSRNDVRSHDGTAPSMSSRDPEDVPVGCDPAFSPVASPRLAYYYGRCAT
jgi:hypothetical protein